MAHLRTGIDRRDWQQRAARAVLAGFAATAAMTTTLLIAYTSMAILAMLLPGTLLGEWFGALTQNTVVELTQRELPLGVMIHLTIGMALAFIYAFVAEPLLPGRDWVRGILFALIPWVLSLVVFLPLLGGGLLGLGLGAGPLPILGNLILHLVYGAMLGAMYGRTGDIEDWRGAGLDTTADASGQQARAARGFETGAAIGIIGGGLFGSILGGAFGVGLDEILPGIPNLDPWTYALIGGFAGTAAGALIGSFAGMTPAPGENRPAAVRTIDRRRRHVVMHPTMFRRRPARGTRKAA